MQRNYNVLDFYISLKNSDDEPETKEYHHSQLKLKVGLDKDYRLYVTVGRVMYDYFFRKIKNLDNVEIEFTSGKNEFL